MRVINEGIARRANKEDNCTGRFWEGRFKSQALLDEKALASCMAYVDLNPIRSKIAHTPCSSAYTSIKKRATEAKKHEQPKGLLPFRDHRGQLNIDEQLPFYLQDYLDLLDWTNQCLSKKGIGSSIQRSPSMLNSLDLQPKHWLYLARHFEAPFKSVVGSAFYVKSFYMKLGQKWVQGIKPSRHLFGSDAHRKARKYAYV